MTKSTSDEHSNSLIYVYIYDMQKKKKMLKSISLNKCRNPLNITDIGNNINGKHLLEKNLDKYISMLIEENSNDLEDYAFDNEFNEFFEFNNTVFNSEPSKCEMDFINDEKLKENVSDLDNESFNLSTHNEEFDEEFDEEFYSSIDSDNDMSNEKYDELIFNIANVKCTFKNLIDKIDENLLNNSYAVDTNSYDKKKQTAVKDETINNSHIPDINSDIFSQINDPCSSLENFGVVLVKWPENISQLWEEYINVPNEWSNEYQLNFQKTISKLMETDEFNLDLSLILKRTTSIRHLETLFGSTWRSKDKNFSRQINRRKKIWSAIEDGLSDGLNLAECINCLESYAYQNNSSISSLYKGVPFRIIDIIDR